MRRKGSSRTFLRVGLTLLALAPVAQAGDRTEVQRVAFSPHGTRALVVTGGVQDGSGFSVAALTALDTGSGRTLLSARARSETRPVPAVVDALLMQERARLAPQGLTPGRTARPVYARTFPVLAPAWTEGVKAGASRVTPVRLWTRPVLVRLSVRALPSSCAYPEMLPGGERPAGFTLTVNGQTVHADRVLPPERSCAARYALDRVYVQGNRAVFILRAYTPGFEGPNAEPLVVAATLK
jgi:predicted secreted protein